jgi:hypothetical protein
VGAVGGGYYGRGRGGAGGGAGVGLGTVLDGRQLELPERLVDARQVLVILLVCYLRGVFH